MINKFKKITKFALFDKFDWNRSVLDKEGNVIDFGKFNIIFGRNYSGKTTLSRMVRAIQTGSLSDKYENPDFCISFQGGKECSQNKLSEHTETIRVFNQDFVRENLKFILNPEEGISSFAIVGAENNKVEENINNILEEIGSNEPDKETGLYLELKVNKLEQKHNSEAYYTADNNLNKELSSKATDKNVGIKYCHKFGDVNYNITKLSSDITKVLSNKYTSLSQFEKESLERQISEQLKSDISKIRTPSFDFESFLLETNILITQKVGNSEKIESLLNDAILNKWVGEGLSYHKAKDLKKCSFCGNDISESRWKKLENHFDEESRLLEKNISKFIEKLILHRNEISEIRPFDKNLFYSRYHAEIDDLNERLKVEIATYLSNLDKLKESLVIRKNAILTTLTELTIKNNLSSLAEIFDKYEDIRMKSNDASNTLEEEQISARERLKLDEIYNFLNAINYSQKKQNILDLESRKQVCDKKVFDTEAKIREKKDEIESLKILLKDEKKGVSKVNEYINDFFGNKFITISLKELDNDEKVEDKKYKFEILRDGVKAYNLSEGECSLISFCYFLARLEDVETKNKEPIIWIDDPISSLDNNHIFFVYSLIKSEIVDAKKCKQLFISTHNLDFLKYLKRLSEKQKFFIIERGMRSSTIKVMPDYLKNCASEFNYLFQQIYKCSNITSVTDDNYPILYNYGNNARKFMELYLYYKFPNGKNGDKDFSNKLELFFKAKIPAVLAGRINNEYSHLSGTFERGSMPIEVKEMISSAKSILAKMENEDPIQYKYFLESIT